MKFEHLKKAGVGALATAGMLAASIGTATFPVDGRTATELIATADRALYQAKRDGRVGRLVPDQDGSTTRS